MRRGFSRIIVMVVCRFVSFILMLGKEFDVRVFLKVIDLDL